MFPVIRPTVGRIDPPHVPVGPLGKFLAVPLTMVIKVQLDNSEEFRWVSVAMAQKKIRMPIL